MVFSGKLLIRKTEVPLENPCNTLHNDFPWNKSRKPLRGAAERAVCSAASRKRVAGAVPAHDGYTSAHAGKAGLVRVFVRAVRVYLKVRKARIRRWESVWESRSSSGCFGAAWGAGTLEAEHGWRWLRRQTAVTWDVCLHDAGRTLPDISLPL